MHWFRANRSLTSYAALFALALQLAVSFGHVHLDGFPLINGATAAAQKPDSSPPAGVPDHDEFCPICALIGLSASLVIPSPPPLIFAGISHEAFFADFADAQLSGARWTQFQARAPPA